MELYQEIINRLKFEWVERLEKKMFKEVLKLFLGNILIE